jgi:methyl-accepting chemotaxis protein
MEVRLMSVRNRLLLGVLVFLGGLTVAIGVLLNLFNQNIGQVLGRNAQSSATSMVDEIDRALFHQIESLRELVTTSPQIQRALEESAAELEAAASPETPISEIMAERDRDWVEGTPAGEERKAAILARPISDLLRSHQAFYRDRYDFELLGEIFLTDRYGANVAETDITSDYLQSDEGWWQEARDNGLAIGDPLWDESAGVLAVALSLRVDDSQGNLAGVLKAALVLDEILRVVRDSREDLGIRNAALEVVTGAGERVLMDGESSLVPTETTAAVAAPTAPEGFRWLDPESGGREVLMGWGRSRGYRDFGGSGWTVRLYLDSGEVMGPVHQLRRSLLAVASITLCLATLIAYLIGRSITRPIDRVVRATDRLARGDFSFDVEGSSRGELGRLLSGLGAVVESGRKTLRGVVSASGRVASAARELTSVSHEISQGAQRQLDSSRRTSTAMESVSTSTEQLADSAEQVSLLVHDTSSSIEEMATSNASVARHSQELARALDRTSQNLSGMATSIQQVADSAQQARGDSETAVSEAQSGSEAVKRMIASIGQVSETLALGLQVMETLDETHADVRRRSRLIDELCEETDLLAINAAIEAAHAGEHGRTFAVVATDMRRLSERSAEAASEIAEVLERVAGELARALEVTATGARDAQEGVALATRAGEALQRIETAVEGTRTRMTEISTATEEQAQASAEGLRAVEDIRGLSLRMEEATREQAAGSQRIAESVAGIRDLAEEVSAASSSQSRESERVARALAEIYRICQEHAETVVHITSISQDLQQQVSELERVAGFFRLSEEGDDGNPTDTRSAEPRRASTGLPDPLPAASATGG